MYVDASMKKQLNVVRKSFEEAKEAFESLQETLEILADKKLLRGIRSSERDYKAGRFHKLSELKA